MERAYGFTTPRGAGAPKAGLLWDLFPSREWAKRREHLQGGWILQIWSLLWTGRERCNAFSRFQVPAWEMTQHLAVTKRMGTLLAATIMEATRARIKCHQVSEHVIFLTGDGREHYRLLPRLGLAVITGSSCFICCM